MNNKIDTSAFGYSFRYLFFIFFLSGFAGLIYESIWTHYLKLFLGHAAYAQTLVLAIFMLGMSVGSWVAARLSSRISQFFLVYAGVELALGLFAFAFNDVSKWAMQIFFDDVAPAFSSPLAINGFKWFIGTALIIPQSILIGMTFPLIANGLLQINRDASGKMLSMLYFTNSIGASVGVLASGFVLVGLVGLPGTMWVSGSVNILIAVLIFLIFRGHKERLQIAGNAAPPGAKTKYNGRVLLLLSVAFFTGLASFVYEITWIRLLSLVLGSATHSFELMLSAFILGLSLGGYFIRNKVDKFESPFGALAIIQIIMGIAAVFSLFLYNYSFEFIQIAFLSLNKIAPGYYLFNLSGHLLCLIIMLPATIFAGMTLPIIIHLLVKEQGDQAVGQTYAVNTIGSIVGILITVHLILPAMGAKNALVIGAFIDVALGLALLGFTRSYTSKVNYIAICLLSMVFFASLLKSELNVHKLVSGVFRHGGINYDTEILYYQDGKTSTVSVERRGDVLVLATNGKPDASMKPAPKKSLDEATQVLVGAIPAILQAEKSNVAIIGFGSGMSTHSMLASDEIKRLDTIEIEPAMVEGARLFHDKVFRAFDDPRSNIVYEDAKTYFATTKNPYDIIIAEPSNPWVSGVSSLFTTDFYTNTKRYLAEGGIFAQWVQTYELSPDLFATIANALGENFNHYDVYSMDSGNVLFIASEKPLPNFMELKDLNKDMSDLLKEFDINSLADVSLHKLGSKDMLAPVFREYSELVNSDYYPYVDQGAVKSRFMGQGASGISAILYEGLPIEERFLGVSPAMPTKKIEQLPWSKSRRDSLSFYNRVVLGESSEFNASIFELFFMTKQDCSANPFELFWASFPKQFDKLALSLPSEKLASLWPYLADHACFKAALEDDYYAQIVHLLEARANSDYATIRSLVPQILDTMESGGLVRIAYSQTSLKKLALWAAVLQKDVENLGFELDEVLEKNPDANWEAYFLITEYNKLVRH